MQQLPAGLLGPKTIYTPFATFFQNQPKKCTFQEVFMQGLQQTIIKGIRCQQLLINKLPNSLDRLTDQLDQIDIKSQLKKKIIQVADIQHKSMLISLKHLRLQNNDLSDMRQATSSWNKNWQYYKKPILNDNLKKTYGIVGKLFSNIYISLVKKAKEALKFITVLMKLVFVDPVYVEELQDDINEWIIERFTYKVQNIDIWDIMPIVSDSCKKQFSFCSVYKYQQRIQLCKYNKLQPVIFPSSQTNHNKFSNSYKTSLKNSIDDIFKNQILNDLHLMTAQRPLGDLNASYMKKDQEKYQRPSWISLPQGQEQKRERRIINQDYSRQKVEQPCYELSQEFQQDLKALREFKKQLMSRRIVQQTEGTDIKTRKKSINFEFKAQPQKKQQQKKPKIQQPAYKEPMVPFLRAIQQLKKQMKKDTIDVQQINKKLSTYKQFLQKVQISNSILETSLYSTILNRLNKQDMYQLQNSDDEIQFTNNIRKKNSETDNFSGLVDSNMSIQFTIKKKIHKKGHQKRQIKHTSIQFCDQIIQRNIEKEKKQTIIDNKQAQQLEAKKNKKKKNKKNKKNKKKQNSQEKQIMQTGQIQAVKVQRQILNANLQKQKDNSRQQSLFIPEKNHFIDQSMSVKQKISQVSASKQKKSRSNSFSQNLQDKISLQQKQLLAFLQAYQIQSERLQCNVQQGHINRWKTAVYSLKQH